MNKRSKILVSLMILALLAGTALAVPLASTYPAAFWIKGKLLQTGGLPADVSGYKVVFYTTSMLNNAPLAAHYAYALSDSSGNFFINAFDDPEINLQTTPSVYIGVVQNSGSGYGVSEGVLAMSTTDLSNGYKNINLTLVAGQGIPDPGGPTPSPPPPTPTPVNDNGQIQKTWIERLSNGDVKLHWVIADTTVTAVDIWQLTTPTRESYKEINRTGLAWAKAYSNVSANEQAISNILNNGSNYYFRVVPTGVSAPFGSTTAGVPYNSISVGKIDVEVFPGLNLFTMPLIMTSAVSTDPNHIDTRLSQAVNGQLVDGEDFYSWTGSTLSLSDNSGGTWSQPNATVGDGLGYWVNAKTQKFVSLTGLVPNAPFQDNLTAGLNLIGYPLPLNNVGIGQIGFNAVSGDDFYWWDDTGKTLKIISLSGTTWPTDPNLILIIGKGNWYNSVGVKARSIPNPVGIYQQ